ncbi:unnamed protein product [Polarella glacialis]|uniref:Mitochondrial carrier protein n=1 Tax=Polarella glacialis TaxID=89957 RepID=A0A813FY72_POLGL|nr:unnamed protein product [Polarella glacialis]
MMEISALDALSGVCGAVCCTYAGLPFDVVKVRLQNQCAQLPGAAHARASGMSAAHGSRMLAACVTGAQRMPGPYRGLGDCLSRVAREEGARALYRGAVPALASAVAENVTGITVQHACHRKLGSFWGNPDARFTLGTECLLGGFTGLFTAVAMCPFEVVKVRIQALRSAEPASRGSAGASGTQNLVACVRKVLEQDGAMGFYRGITGLSARDVPYNAIFFGTYEGTCTLIMHSQGIARKDELRPWAVMSAGGFAGAVGWSIVIPFDVAKTRLQSGKMQGSVVHALRTIAAKEGARALFFGWAAAVTRAVPANAGLFFGVEMSGRWLRQHWDD